MERPLEVKTGWKRSEWRVYDRRPGGRWSELHIDKKSNKHYFDISPKSQNDSRSCNCPKIGKIEVFLDSLIPSIAKKICSQDSTSRSLLPIAHGILGGNPVTFFSGIVSVHPNMDTLGSEISFWQVHWVESWYLRVLSEDRKGTKRCQQLMRAQCHLTMHVTSELDSWIHAWS